MQKYSIATTFSYTHRKTSALVLVRSEFRTGNIFCYIFFRLFRWCVPTTTKKIWQKVNVKSQQVWKTGNVLFWFFVIPKFIYLFIYFSFQFFFVFLVVRPYYILLYYKRVLHKQLFANEHLVTRGREGCLRLIFYFKIMTNRWIFSECLFYYLKNNFLIFLHYWINLFHFIFHSSQTYGTKKKCEIRSLVCSTKLFIDVQIKLFDYVPGYKKK